MSILAGRRILLGVTGGIAAYKAAFLCRLFQEAGAEVRVAMTRAGTKFVTPLTFEALTQHPVATQVFPRREFVATRHIAWAQWADMCVVAPATYDFVAKVAHGFADDMLASLIAALPADRPLFMALAMNTAMYEQPVFQDNVALLKKRGVQIIDAETGYLAEMMEGKGRMAEPQEIVAAIVGYLESKAPWHGKKILVTAGPTREKIDPVRYISNASSGKMGYAVAEAAMRAGAEVTLVSGPVSLAAPRGVKRIDVTTAAEMADAVGQHWPQHDALFMVAAVADFVPREPARDKIKKADFEPSLALQPAPDILAGCGRSKRDDQILVGFAVETDRELENAQAKLEAKNLDMIVVNNPNTPGAAFDVDTNVVTVLTRDGSEELPLMTKREAAEEILARALPLTLSLDAAKKS